MIPEKDKNNELQAIKKKIIKVQIIGSPGAILLGLGLYAKYGTNSSALHPLLADDNFVTGLLVTGAIIEIALLYILVGLFRKQSALSQ